MCVDIGMLAGAAGGGLLDKMGLGSTATDVIKWLDPVTYHVGAMFKKPADVPNPPEAPAAPEAKTQEEVALRKLTEERRLARMRLARSRSGTLRTSPLGVTGPVAVASKSLLGQ